MRADGVESLTIDRFDDVPNGHAMRVTPKEREAIFARQREQGQKNVAEHLRREPEPPGILRQIVDQCADLEKRGARPTTLFLSPQAWLQFYDAASNFLMHDVWRERGVPKPPQAMRYLGMIIKPMPDIAVTADQGPAPEQMVIPNKTAYCCFLRTSDNWSALSQYPFNATCVKCSSELAKWLKSRQRRKDYDAKAHEGMYP